MEIKPVYIALAEQIDNLEEAMREYYKYVEAFEDARAKELLATIYDASLKNESMRDAKVHTKTAGYKEDVHHSEVKVRVISEEIKSLQIYLEAIGRLGGK
jgi:hypothetical protein